MVVEKENGPLDARAEFRRELILDRYVQSVLQLCPCRKLEILLNLLQPRNRILLVVARLQRLDCSVR